MLFSSFGDKPLEDHAVWHPEPTSRGTFSILSTSLLTMALCVWTAVHLNLPGPGDSIYKQTLRKTGWLLVALLTPEFLTFVAFLQYKQARDLTQYMKKQSGHRKPDSPFRAFFAALGKGDVESSGPASQDEVSCIPEWSMVHSFYVLMGGFAIDTSESGRESDQNFLPDETATWGIYRSRIFKGKYPGNKHNRTRFTLTTEAFKNMVNHVPESIPALSTEYIQDKSKASGLAKAVVCFQAAWFLAHCLTRLCQGISVSLLELSTFGHALCTLITYVLWWSKPLDIKEPTLIKDEAIYRLFAALLMQNRDRLSPFCPRNRKGRALSITYTYTFDDAMNNEMSAREGRSKLSKLYLPDKTTKHSEPDQSGSVPVRWNDEHGNQVVDLQAGQSLYGFSFSMSKEENSDEGSKPLLPNPAPSQAATDSQQCIRLRKKDVWLLKLAASGQKRYGIDIHPSDTLLLIPRSYNFPSFDEGKRPAFYIAFFVSGPIYGCIHLIAWNASFLNVTESLLWRASGVVLAASGILFLLAYLLVFLIKLSEVEFYFIERWVGSTLKVYKILTAPFRILSCLTQSQIFCYLNEIFDTIADCIEGISGRFLHCVDFVWMCLCKLVCVVLLASLPLAYIFSRVYLVVGCFINLAYLPDSALKVTAWTQYFPHIG